MGPLNASFDRESRGCIPDAHYLSPLSLFNRVRAEVVQARKDNEPNHDPRDVLIDAAWEAHCKIARVGTACIDAIRAKETELPLEQHPSYIAAQQQLTEATQALNVFTNGHYVE